MSKKSKTAGLEQFKMEAAREVGVTLGQGYNGELTAKQAGSVGGQMVKKMIESYENSMNRHWCLPQGVTDLAYAVRVQEVCVYD